jgi:hypothetical protein
VQTAFVHGPNLALLVPAGIATAAVVLSTPGRGGTMDRRCWLAKQFGQGR